MTHPVTIAYLRAVERFNAKVIKTEGCWSYPSPPSYKGYHYLSVGGRSKSVHRFSYELHKGPIPEGLQIDHLCRNRGCCNPDHLEPVTALENSRRGLAGQWEVAKTHCPHGHAYSEENTYVYRGKRQCRECRREKIRVRDRARVAARKVPA